MDLHGHTTKQQQQRLISLTSVGPDIIHVSSPSSSSPHPISTLNVPVPTLQSVFDDADTPPCNSHHIVDHTLSSPSQPIYIPHPDGENSNTNLLKRVPSTDNKNNRTPFHLPYFTKYHYSSSSRLTGPSSQAKRVTTTTSETDSHQPSSTYSRFSRPTPSPRRPSTPSTTTPSLSPSYDAEDLTCSALDLISMMKSNHENTKQVPNSLREETSSVMTVISTSLQTLYESSAESDS